MLDFDSVSHRANFRDVVLEWVHNIEPGGGTIMRRTPLPLSHPRL